jgi:hypothetical protein
VCKGYLVEYLLDDLCLPQFPALAFTAELRKGSHIGQVLSQALRKLQGIHETAKFGIEGLLRTSSFATFSSSV